MFCKTIIVALLVSSAYCRILEIKNSGPVPLTVSIDGLDDITVLVGQTVSVTVDDNFNGTISAVPVGLEAIGGPRTKAVLSLSPLEDSYSVSLVDGFNLNAQITPIQGVGCLVASCLANINAVCPLLNRVVNLAGITVGCTNSPLMKILCPNAVVSSNDLLDAVFECQAESYQISFG